MDKPLTQISLRHCAIVIASLLSLAAGLWMAWRHFYPPALAPTQFLQPQHGISVIRFSPDGKWLIAADAIGGTTVWDAATRRQVRQWPEAADKLWFSKDATKYLASHFDAGEKSTSYTVRDITTGQILHKGKKAGSIVTASPDLLTLVNTTDYRSLNLVEVATGRRRGQFITPGLDLHRIRYSLDGHYVSVVCLGQPSYVLQASNLRPVLTLPSLTNMRVARDGKNIIGVARDGIIHFWEIASRRHTTLSSGLTRATWIYDTDNGGLVLSGFKGSEGKPHHVIQVRSADGKQLLYESDGQGTAFSPNLRFVAERVYPHKTRLGLGTPAAIKIYDVFDKKHLVSLDITTGPFGQRESQGGLFGESTAISPTGRQFVVGTAEGAVRFYDLDQRASSQPYITPKVASLSSRREVLSFSSELGNVAIAPTGAIAACGVDDKYKGEYSVKLLLPGELARTFEVPRSLAAIENVGFSPDGETLIGSSQWGIWKLDIRKLLRHETPFSVGPPGEQSRAYNSVGRPVWFNDSHESFAIVSNEASGAGPITVKHWNNDAASGEKRVVVPPQQSKKGGTFSLRGTELSPDGQKMVVLWNGVLRKTQNGKTVHEMMQSGIIEIRDTATGYVLRELKIPTIGKYRGSALGRPAWSPDASRIAVANELGQIFVWDAATGESVARLSVTRAENRSYTGAFVSIGASQTARLAFTPNGRFLIAARDDGSLYLYSLKTHQPVGQIGKAPAPLRWMQCAPDSKTVYGVVLNGKSVLAWDLPELPTEES